MHDVFWMQIQAWRTSLCRLRQSFKRLLSRKVSKFQTNQSFSYGFCHGENKFNTFKFRVIIGTSPVEAIKCPSDLLPTKSILEDRNNIDVTTEEITLSHQRLCFALLNYLRSVMTPNYKETGLPDADQIMISCPRLIPYELLVIDFAIRLLEQILKDLCALTTQT